MKNQCNKSIIINCCSVVHFLTHYTNRYSSTLFLTSGLEGGEGSASRLGRILPPGKTRYPFYRRMGGPQGRSGQVRKISSPPGVDPRTVQPVGSRYTDYATRALSTFKKSINVVVLKVNNTNNVSSSNNIRFYALERV